MSVEKLAAKELRRAAFWRATTIVVHFPGTILQAIAQIILRVADLFDELSDVTFSFEADAARRYRTLTGVDLGFAVKGDLDRYAGTNPRALAIAEKDEYEDGDVDDD
jgi:hypothetical protein